MGILERFKPSLCCMFRSTSTSTTEEQFIEQFEFDFDSLVLELQEDILSRLSQKQLHRCRCVSKHWEALINSQNFILACQLRHRLKDHFQGSSKIMALDSSAIISINFGTDIVCNVLTPNHGLTESHVGIEPTIIGSFNVLVCFRGRIKKSFKYTLYNLKTGAYRVVVTKNSPAKSEFFFGFGYDSVGDDHKIVRIVFKLKKRVGVKEEFHAYSFKANSWKIAISKPYPKSCQVIPFTGLAAAISSHNALHWIRGFRRIEKNITDTNITQITGFDLGTHESFEMTLPNGYWSSRHLQGKLTTLNGCLHIIGGHAPCTGKLNIWIKKEYGINRPWTKLYCYSSLDSISKVLSSKFFANPFNSRFSVYAYSEDGKELLIGRSFWKNDIALRYNLQSKEIKDVDLLELLR